MNFTRRESILHIRKRVPRRYAAVEEREYVWVSLHTDSEQVAMRKALAVWDHMLEAWEAKLVGAPPMQTRNWPQPRTSPPCGGTLDSKDGVQIGEGHLTILTAGHRPGLSDCRVNICSTAANRVLGKTLQACLGPLGKMPPQHAEQSIGIGQRKLDFEIKPPGAHDGGIDQFGVVAGADDIQN